MALIERNHYRDEEPEAFPPGAIPISRRPRKDQGFQFRNDFEPVRVEIANVVMHVLMEDSKRPRADSRRTVSLSRSRWAEGSRQRCQ